GIRNLLTQRLASLPAGVQELSAYTRDLVAAMDASPVALCTEEANAQHYEVPADYFATVLGPNRKYSCCYWAPKPETWPLPRPPPWPSPAGGRESPTASAFSNWVVAGAPCPCGWPATTRGPGLPRCPTPPPKSSGLTARPGSGDWSIWRWSPRI